MQIWNLLVTFLNLVLNDLQENRELSEYDLPQSQTVDNDRFVCEFRREIDYDRGEQ